MKTVIYFCLGTVFAASIVLAGFLLHGPKEKETWSTLTAVLALITAVVAVIPALRVLQIQEDSQRPRPIPHFDLTSRYDILQLRVRNFGASVAYDIQMKWKTCPFDQDGKEIRSLDHVSALLPQDSVSTAIGTSHGMVQKYADTQFEGECTYKDASGKRFREQFICSVDASQKQLIHDNELPKTLRELQDIPKELSRIADQLKRLSS